MDKNTYETFELLPDNNRENETSQYIVLQDDGTFVTVNNRPIQYVTQEDADDKEIVDGVAPSIIYNVAPQQFYVDVDNSSDLISVSDQYIIPDEGSNAYGNSFLLQAVQNKVEQMEQDEPIQYKEVPSVEVNTEIENAEVNTNSDCTEITLSDDQYQLLEQKGWILLETADKVYLLDTLGLHDITADRKLIEKLKSDTTNEDHMSLNKMEGEEISYENKSNFVTTEIEGPMDYIVEEDAVEQDEVDSEIYINNKTVTSEPEVIIEENANENTHLTAEHDYVKVTSFNNTSYKRDGEALRIKTKFSFKDIPPEIVLGRTVHGKKLVASVKTEKQNLKSALTNKAVGEKFQRVSDEDSEEHLKNDTGLEEEKLQRLIQDNLCGNTESYSIKDVTAAEIVVEQLLRVPAFKPTIMERRLVITKVVREEYAAEQTFTTETYPTMVTGRVIRSGGKITFRHIPDLLRRSLSSAQVVGKVIEDNFLHIHIREMKGVDGITRISITLNKRHIPLAKIARNARNKQKMTYACSACAAYYNTEEGLKLHQETECVEIDNNLTIDNDNTNNYNVVFTNKGKEYMCNTCHSIFTKLSNCQKHIKSHFSQETINESEENYQEDDNKQPNKVFRCKMCPSTYLHAATLSKHIVTKHIRIKTT